MQVEVRFRQRFRQDLKLFLKQHQQLVIQNKTSPFGQHEVFPDIRVCEHKSDDCVYQVDLLLHFSLSWYIHHFLSAIYRALIVLCLNTATDILVIVILSRHCHCN